MNKDSLASLPQAPRNIPPNSADSNNSNSQFSGANLELRNDVPQDGFCNGWWLKYPFRGTARDLHSWNPLAGSSRLQTTGRLFHSDGALPIQPLWTVLSAPATVVQNENQTGVLGRFEFCPLPQFANIVADRALVVAGHHLALPTEHIKARRC